MKRDILNLEGEGKTDCVEAQQLYAQGNMLEILSERSRPLPQPVNGCNCCLESKPIDSLDGEGLAIDTNDVPILDREGL